MTEPMSEAIPHDTSAKTPRAHAWLSAFGGSVAQFRPCPFFFFGLILLIGSTIAGVVELKAHGTAIKDYALAQKKHEAVQRVADLFSVRAEPSSTQGSTAQSLQATQPFETGHRAMQIISASLAADQDPRIDPALIAFQKMIVQLHTIMAQGSGNAHTGDGVQTPPPDLVHIMDHSVVGLQDRADQLLTESRASLDFILTSEQCSIGLNQAGIALCIFALLSMHRRQLNRAKQSNKDLEQVNLALNVMVKERDTHIAHVERLFERSLSHSKMTMFIQNKDLVYSWFHNPRFGHTSSDIIGKSDTDCINPSLVPMIVGAKKKAIETGESQHYEFKTCVNGVDLQMWTQVDPIIEGDEVIGLIGVSHDVTETRQREANIEFLTSELLHRSKNLLSVIGSMARRMIEKSKSLEEFEARFRLRLHALTRSFDLVMLKNWRPVCVSEVITSQLTSLVPYAMDRIQVSGDSVSCPPHLAEIIGCAIYELGLNAREHGALKPGEGQVFIQWKQDHDSAGQRQFMISWTETTHQTSVPMQQRQGYGLDMLDYIVPRSLGGASQISFEPGGFRWIMTCPWPEAVTVT
jgi:two-component sensor histidine kinase